MTEAKKQEVKPVEQEVKPVEQEVKPVEQEVKPVEAKSEGSEIAKAISEGLEKATAKKGFEVTVDDSVDHRFSVVKNAEGEVMVRENETGVLSKV